MNVSSPSPLFPNKKRETGAHPVSLEKLFIFHPNSSVNWMEKDFPFSCYLSKLYFGFGKKSFLFLARVYLCSYL
ncbi:hypothetical protein B4119_0464 [Parageobacillus caldoxylosilyticus]|uniref:Uncharacterized protein n=1 Tax=Saccharococcus caldoxylosilyticus TaxID=81408 RepID=A0A150KTZ7_9BACL|nr:hypothetical protein B4119_0464 [Parageobacillus caldoxylosilyticus]